MTFTAYKQFSQSFREMANCTGAKEYRKGLALFILVGKTDESDVRVVLIFKHRSISVS